MVPSGLPTKYLCMFHLSHGRYMPSQLICAAVVIIIIIVFVVRDVVFLGLRAARDKLTTPLISIQINA
jgi:hypothetical protein